jgi:hypothetical protein
MVASTRTKKRRRWRRWKKKRHSPAESHLYVSCPAGAAVMKAPLLLLLLLPSLLFLRLRLPPFLLLLSLLWLSLLHLLVLLLLLLLLPLPPKRMKIRPGRLQMDAKPRRRMEGENRATRTNCLADLTTANKIIL